MTARDASRARRARAALALLAAAPAEHVRDALFLLDLTARRITTGHDAAHALHRARFDCALHDAGTLLTDVLTTLCGGDIGRLPGLSSAVRVAVVNYVYALLARQLGRVCHCPASARLLAADLASAEGVRVDTVAEAQAVAEQRRAS